MNTMTMRIAKAIAGVIIIAILLVLVNKWWAEYRNLAGKQSTMTPAEIAAAEQAAEKGGSKDGTGTADSKITVVVLTAGLNLREKPDGDSDAIRGLSKGEKLTLIKKLDEWYQVEDRSGKRGWISSKVSYTKLVR